MLKPELNIAQIAGAPFTGRLHNKETKKNKWVTLKKELHLK